MSNISMTYPTKTITVKNPEEEPQKIFNTLSEVKKTYFPNCELEVVIQKSMMSCPLCNNTAIEIVGRCATCKVCGWSFCSA